jgi:hypothetical protein
MDTIGLIIKIIIIVDKMQTHIIKKNQFATKKTIYHSLRLWLYELVFNSVIWKNMDKHTQFYLRFEQNNNYIY